MKGKYRVVVQNNRLHYEFEIRRNITIIQGDSATGKTTLINMLRQAENLGRSSGVDVVCEVPCRVLEGANWKLLLQNMHGNIIFTDEENAFINTEEFAAEVRKFGQLFCADYKGRIYIICHIVWKKSMDYMHLENIRIQKKCISRCIRFIRKCCPASQNRRNCS